MSRKYYIFGGGIIVGVEFSEIINYMTNHFSVVNNLQDLIIWFIFILFISHSSLKG